MTIQVQIRTPPNVVFADVLEEMTCKGWDEIKPEFKNTWYSPVIFSEFYRNIREASKPYVTTYDFCGCFPECSGGAENASWMSPDDHLYQVSIGLDNFVEDLAFGALQAGKPLLKQESVNRVFDQLQTAFRKVLTRYLYSNPGCRKSAICSFSQEIDPWTQKRFPSAGNKREI